MKKIAMLFLLVILMFSMTMTSCYHSEKELQEIEAMFNSFNHSSDYVLLTHFELVVSDKHYNRSEIKYNNKLTNVVFLEQKGFYSYTVDDTGLNCEFIYTTYDNFETLFLGNVLMPSKVIDGFWKDSCYYLEIDDPTTEEFKRIYCCFDTSNKMISYVDNVSKDDNYEIDKSRNNRYTFSYNTKSYFNYYLDITDNQSGETKRITKSFLKNFEEGRMITKYKSDTIFNPEKAYVVEDDIYLLFNFGAGLLADNQYYYIVKWNFNTEECSFVTSIYFDYFQEWLDDVIIINS